MARVYVIDSEGRTEPMQEIRCVNEDLELQRILEKNPDLIPGDQINPSDPRRWLLVKREMPVPDPSTGDNRWSIDLFIADQDAMPTFIECKRYNDTRARREVVGQMLEYAANGHYYWSKDDMLQYARDACQKTGISLEEELKRLQGEEVEAEEDFFQRVQDNLREGQVRLVFFLEEASQELKSVVDFLNKQMERSEVLLVEARQYEHQGLKVVAPTLFGFTEEARQIKKTVTITTGQRKKWTKENFFQDAKERLNDMDYASIKKLFEKSLELGGEISWGTGKEFGSFTFKWPNISSGSLFSVYSGGSFSINYGSFARGLESDESLNFLKEQFENKAKLPAPPDFQGRYPNYRVADWAKEVDSIIEILELLLKKGDAR